MNFFFSLYKLLKDVDQHSSEKIVGTAGIEPAIFILSGYCLTVRPRTNVGRYSVVVFNEVSTDSCAQHCLPNNALATNGLLLR